MYVIIVIIVSLQLMRHNIFLAVGYILLAIVFIQKYYKNCALCSFMLLKKNFLIFLNRDRNGFCFVIFDLCLINVIY